MLGELHRIKWCRLLGSGDITGGKGPFHGAQVTTNKYTTRHKTGPGRTASTKCSEPEERRVFFFGCEKVVKKGKEKSRLLGLAGWDNMQAQDVNHASF